MGNFTAEAVRCASALLQGRELGRRFPFLARGYGFLLSRFVKGLAVRRVLGHTMHLDLNDRGVCLPIYLNGIYEPEETILFRDLVKPGMVVVDIGAHVGYYTLIAAAGVGQQGRVFAFEPHPSNYSLLVRNVETNRYRNVITIPNAVSDRSGSLRLFEGWANTGDHRIYDTCDGRPWINVRSTTLDEFFSDWGEDRVDVIKMDIQGAEGAAFRGMTNVVQNNQNLRIISEFWPLAIEGFGYSSRGVLDTFAEHGFRFYLITGRDGRVNPVQADEVLARCGVEGWVNLLLER